MTGFPTDSRFAMQIQMQAICRRSQSLRKAITDDLTRRPHKELIVQEIISPTSPTEDENRAV